MAKVRMAVLDPIQARRDAARGAWRKASEAKAQKVREDRAKDLEDRQHLIDETRDAYRALPELNAPVRIRGSALFIDPARPLPPSLGGPPWPKGMTVKEQKAQDLRTRRPLARLVGLKGAGLITYLSMIYTMQAEAAEVDRHPLAVKKYAGDVPWALLCGRQGGTPRARHERMRRDLGSLEAAGVAMRDTTMRQGDPNIRFLMEDGSGETYRLPAGTEDELLGLPAAFFLNGWHLVLTPQEIIMLLTVRDAYERMSLDRPSWSEHGVPLTQHTRWARYGVSGEAYTAIHELFEFGLIAIHDPMGTRVKGKFTPPTPEERAEYEANGHAFSPEPYQLRPVGGAFDRQAVYAVSQCLDASTLPPRMHEFDLLDILPVKAGITTLNPLDGASPSP